MSVRTLSFTILLALIAPFLFVGVQASHCGTGISVLTTEPTGFTLDNPPLIRAVFQDTGSQCLSSATMVLDGVDVTSSATVAVQGTQYVVSYQPPAPLSPGSHHVQVDVYEACCNNNGGTDSGSASWTFTIISGAAGTLPGHGFGYATPGSVVVPTITNVGPIATPPLAPTPVSTPTVTIPYTCAPANVVCAGPFSIPGTTIATTPGVPSQQLLPQTPVPPTTTVTLPTGAAVSASLDPVAYNAVATPSSTTPFGPATVIVPTPFGSLPVTVCATPCPIPDPASASATTQIGVSVTAASQSQSFQQAVAVGV